MAGCCTTIRVRQWQARCCTTVRVRQWQGAVPPLGLDSGRQGAVPPLGLGSGKQGAVPPLGLGSGRQGAVPPLGLGSGKVLFSSEYSSFRYFRLRMTLYHRHSPASMCLRTTITRFDFHTATTLSVICGQQRSGGGDERTDRAIPFEFEVMASVVNGHPVTHITYPEVSCSSCLECHTRINCI